MASVQVSASAKYYSLVCLAKIGAEKCFIVDVPETPYHRYLAMNVT
jgi:hypothetical protein